MEPTFEVVLRRAGAAVVWGFLLPPDTVGAARHLSRRLRRELVAEGDELRPPHGIDRRMGPISVRLSRARERPWWGLGLAVRCRVEAQAKLSVVFAAARPTHRRLICAGGRPAWPPAASARRSGREFPGLSL